MRRITRLLLELIKGAQVVEHRRLGRGGVCHRPMAQAVTAAATGSLARSARGSVTKARRRRGTKTATLTAAAASSPAPSASLA